MDNTTSSKKPYLFGNFEVTDFDSLASSYSPELKDLAIYARIPAMMGDCNDGASYYTMADFCTAIN